MRALAMVLVVLGAGGCFGSCRQTVVQEGTCDPGSAAPVDELDIGADEDPFRAFADGDVIDPVVGGQGATMVVVRLRVRGATAPACLLQSTRVFSADGRGDVLAQSDASLATTLEPDGTRTTGSLLLPGDIPRPGEGLLITTKAGGQTTTRALSVRFTGYFDFSPDDDAGD